MEEEHIAYSSPDWDGIMQDGRIIDDGTRGWCITRLGETIIHAHEPVEVWTLQRSTDAPIRMRFIDCMQSGVLTLN